MAQGARRVGRSRAETGNAAKRSQGSPRTARTTARGAFAVVGIGASAGGLDAFQKLLEALPADAGIAVVLISHLDPTHKSMLVDLLGAHTIMPVVQAADGMPLERNHVYIIPPQAFLSVRDGSLRLSQPKAPHGARLPFDFFLNSLASAYGERAVCVVLSGTGADGSLGLRAVSESGGLVIAQDPDEAAYDGMPRNAIATGAVNLVMPVAEIPQALIRYASHPYVTAIPGTAPAAEAEDEAALPEIIELLHVRTSRNFAHYRKATLLRRVQRRMAAAGTRRIADYLSVLRRDNGELQLLAKDFLIHVTSFFRDPAAFEGLAKIVVTDLVQHSEEEAIRVWVPGCSTGEEAYSLAILFLEEFAATKRTAKLQIFASDIGTDALEVGRRGLYPESIEADVSAERLQRFFTRQEHGYRVTRELRDVTVFADHDLLADPPFSRVDLVSCRNLLIYLQPEEQRKALSLCHFALRRGGYLFLGASESIGHLTEYFRPISNPLRIFSRIGQDRARERVPSASTGVGVRALWPRMTGRFEQRLPNLGEAAQRLLAETYAPATVVVDRRYRALYVSGPTDLYLRVPSGELTHDALAMLREGLAPHFRAAIRQASRNRQPVTIGGARVRRNGDFVSVSISARPLIHEEEALVLVSFADEPERSAIDATLAPAEASRVAQLEQELEDARKELESTIRELEDSNQELSTTNEEALSINEEFQSTNEELETSKEELQSLNEELTTTNNQLHETLERQRRTSDDLQNILNSSDAATLFLDENLNIRFFSPSVAAQFNLIASDVGRPLADLVNPFPDCDLPADARAVIMNLTAIRREIRSASGAWYTCRTLPYRTQDNHIEGVVISLTEISEIKRAQQQSEAIINTVSEPLIVLDETMHVVSAGRSFYRYFDASPADTLGQALPDTDAHHLDVPALRAFLDGLKGQGSGVRSCEIEIDLPQLGRRTLIVTAEEVKDAGQTGALMLVALNDITDHRNSEQQLASARQAAEQANIAKSRFLAAASHDLRQPLQALALTHGALRGEVTSDSGAELLRRATATIDAMSDMLSALLDIDQLETGTIHPQSVDFPINSLLDRIADEFVAPASAQSLGLRVVRCRLAVHSDPRLLGQIVRNLASNAIRYTPEGKVLIGCRRRGEKLSIEVWDTGIGVAPEDIPRIFEEYRRASDGASTGSLGLGLAIVRRLADLLHHPVRVRSTPGKGSLFAVDVPLVPLPPGQTRGPSEPRGQGESGRGGAGALPDAAGIGDSAEARPANTSAPTTIFVVDDDGGVRESMRMLLGSAGYGVETFANAEAFLAAKRTAQRGCLITDLQMPGVGGSELLARLVSTGMALPIIVMTAHGDVATAVELIKAGAADFIEKPVHADELLACIDRALRQTVNATEHASSAAAAALRLAGLTRREREVIDHVFAGRANKETAFRLGIAQRTVETHRASAMKKMGAASLPDLVRLMLSARGAAAPL